MIPEGKDGRRAVEAFVGTSGFSYESWRGAFYPEGLPSGEMLRFYAGRLPAVEINNTFYRLPRAAVLGSWAEQVGESFRFALKASRRITHVKRLKEAEEETGYLVRTAGTLGERLGAILFQLPPHLRKDLPRLERFLDSLPESTPAAFEFRHPSWLEDDVFGALGARGRALCVSDSEEGPAAPLLRAAPFAYLRLRRAGYDEADLAAWAKRIRSLDLDRVFVFFKHEEEGAGPELAARFLRRLVRASPHSGSAPGEDRERARAGGTAR
jgi:uncharacterized protein YecE (DUF72 family)